MLICSKRFEFMVYTYICGFWETKFFWLLRPSKSSGALKKDLTVGFLTFEYALKNEAWGQHIYKHCPVSNVTVVRGLGLRKEKHKSESNFILSVFIFHNFYLTTDVWQYSLHILIKVSFHHVFHHKSFYFGHFSPNSFFPVDKMSLCGYWILIKRWSEAELFTIFENHLYSH